MTVSEHVGFDDHRLADDPLRRKFPTVDLRSDVLDDYTRLAHGAGVRS